MKIENLSELSKLLDLLNKKGVTAYSVDGLQLTLSGNPAPSNYKRKQEESGTFGEEAADWSDLSPEEQLFYSTGGIPIQVKTE
jgi:hypothetical protein